MKRVWIIGCNLVIALWSPTDGALACQCLGVKSVAASLESSAAVFSGRVKNIYGTRITFVVDRSWKGKVTAEMAVYTPAQSTACGYEFERGEPYLVYAYSEGKERLGTNTCTRTKRLAQAEDDLTELGEGTRINQKRGWAEVRDRFVDCSFEPHNKRA
jgi:hypothetical protein